VISGAFNNKCVHLVGVIIVCICSSFISLLKCQTSLYFPVKIAVWRIWRHPVSPKRCYVHGVTSQMAVIWIFTSVAISNLVKSSCGVPWLNPVLIYSFETNWSRLPKTDSSLWPIFIAFGRYWLSNVWASKFVRNLHESETKLRRYHKKILVLANRA
jgi:hypothetical protein